MLCSLSLLAVLFESTPADLLESWGRFWLVGANPGFPTEEATVVLPTAPLGGKLFGRRSGRPDCMTGHDRRKNCLSCVVREALHMLEDWIYVGIPQQNSFSLVLHSSWNPKNPQLLPLSPSVFSMVSVLTWCWSKGCWLLPLVWVISKGPEPAVFFKGPCATARRFLDGEVFTGHKRENVNEEAIEPKIVR